MAGLPPIPPQLKSLTHYLKIAVEHDQRDPVIAYWCRFHSVQTGLAIDKSSAEAKTLLFALLDWLENKKKEYRDNESITNEHVAQAYLENYILKIFNSADGQDRAGVFNKNVVKAFYTSGLLIDVLTNFNNGQLGEDFEKTRKYAKWKAAYIHNCLKNGETPISGPMPEEDDDEALGPIPSVPNADQIVNQSYQPQPPDNYSETSFLQPRLPSNNVYNIEPTPSPGPSSSVSVNYEDITSQGPVPLGIEQTMKAQKYCKWAGSALNFDDIPGAIVNLEKALRLLKTGQDSD